MTGEHFVVICGGSAEDIQIIFETEINLIENFIRVITDTNFTTLDKEKYEMIR